MLTWFVPDTPGFREQIAIDLLSLNQPNLPNRSDEHDRPQGEPQTGLWLK